MFCDRNLMLKTQSYKKNSWKKYSNGVIDNFVVCVKNYIVNEKRGKKGNLGTGSYWTIIHLWFVMSRIQYGIPVCNE